MNKKVEQIKDPVCGMDVSEDAELHTEHDGQSFYFCSVHCLFMIALFSVILWSSGCGKDQPAVQIVTIPNNGIAPDVEIDGEGNLHLVYMADNNIYYIKSEDSDQHFNEPIRVNTEPGTAQAGAFRGPDIAIGPEGRIHVIWYTNAFQRKLPPEEWGVHYAYMNPSDTVFAPARNLNHIPSDNYSLAVSSEQVAVFWTSDSLYMQVSENNGEMFTEPSAIAQADPCECCATRAYFSQTGDLFVAYREKANNIRDMHILRRGAGEQAFVKQALSQTTWQIEACPMSGSYLTGGQDRGLMAAWETKGDIYFGRVDETGELLIPGEIHVSDQGKYPVVLRTSDGTTLVTWKEGTALQWQMYDEEGHAIIDQETVDTASPHRPAGVVTWAGAFVLFP